MVSPSDSTPIPFSTANGDKSLPASGGSPVRLAGNPLNGSNFSDVGPGPITGGQSENVSPNNEVSGAAHVVLPHPSDPNILYAGFTNGGIWKTTNATNSSPTWTPQGDALGSLSIGAMAFDLSDSTNQTLYAGAGRYSTFGQLGGSRSGIFRTVDGGTSWGLVSGTSMLGRNISGIVARGSTIVVSVNSADSFTYGNIGIWRSSDSGASFTQISGGTGAATGLPGGVTYDLVADPSSSTTLYTATVFSDTIGGVNGVYKSTNTGLTWTRISTLGMQALITNNTGNVELAVGNSNNVYVAIVNSGVLNSVWRSGDGGSNWSQMDTPGTTENSIFYGIHPGGQGNLHLSICADPSNSNIVYIAGDRQPVGEAGVSNPNSIGATNRTGRLFRGNASASSGSQWVPLTHSNSVPAFPGGGTANSSAPSADSREMAIDAAGRLIEGSSGGVYVRTNPNSNTGDWAAIQGNLKTTEIHSVAYDSVSNKLLMGAIDTGIAQESSAGTWETVTQDDGGDVAVDDISLAGSGQSIRYSSRANLGGLTRRTYNTSGVQVGGAVLCPLSGATVTSRFLTTIKLNRINPNRLLILGNNGIFESLDQGATAASVSTFTTGDGLNGSSLDYGGKSGGVDNPDVIYAVRTNQVTVRTAAAPAAFNTYTVASTLRDVVMDRNDFNTAYTVTSSQVFKTTNTGANWANVTGDLGSVGNIRCVEFIPTANGGTVVIGTQTGVYVAKNSNPTEWFRLGNNMPQSVYVSDLEYDATDNVLVVGTLGRGVWVMNNADSVASVPVSMTAWEVQ